MVVKVEELRERQSLVQTVQFPVGRIHGLLSEGNYAERVGAGAPVYLEAVMEYLAAKARNNNKTRIIPFYSQLVIRNDEELYKFLSGFTIAHCGFIAEED